MVEHTRAVLADTNVATCKAAATDVIGAIATGIVAYIESLLTNTEGPARLRERSRAVVTYVRMVACGAECRGCAAGERNG